MKPTVYSASKTWHAPMWRKLRDEGLNIISSWIDMEKPTSLEGYQSLWRLCAAESSLADVTIMYIADGSEVHRGAWVEVGCALGNGRRVFLVNPTGAQTSDCQFHQNVTKFSSLEEAIDAINWLMTWGVRCQSTHKS